MVHNGSYETGAFYRENEMAGMLTVLVIAANFAGLGFRWDIIADSAG